MYPIMVNGDGVVLREFGPEDIDAVLAIYGDPVATRHLSFEPRTREQVQATITAVTEAAKVESRIEYSLAAALPSTGEVIGFARLAVDTQHAGQNSGQIGFALRTDVWGRGFGTETVRLLLTLGFEHLGLHRIWGARAPDNAVSDHLMRKLGMVVEGRIRHHLLVRGAWRDSVVHSILEDEWSERGAASGA